MAVGHAGIAAHRRLVGLRRFRDAIHVLEQQAEVVEQHRIAAAGSERVAVGLRGLGEAPGLMQEERPVDARLEMRRIGGDGFLVGLQRALGVIALQRKRRIEPIRRITRLDGRGLAFDHPQRTLGGIAAEFEQVLAGLGLPAAAAFLDDDAVGHGADAQPRQRHRLGKLAAKLFHGARDAPLRHVRLRERLRRAQQDQILEGEEPAVARALRWRYEAGGDQRPDGAAGNAKQALDVANAVRVHDADALVRLGFLRRLAHRRRHRLGR